jgi:hypothetical protein
MASGELNFFFNQKKSLETFVFFKNKKNLMIELNLINLIIE